MNDKIMLESALEYIRRGWWVFPTHTVDDEGSCSCGKKDCSSKGKHPRGPNGLLDASNDEKQLLKWFGENSPASNIAIVTGEKSGLTVIDIDIGPGKNGAESWTEACGEHGEPNTLMVQTGSGGMHVYFKYNSSLKTAGNVLGKGVDCRNDGGYVIAPPSNHKSGGVYSWIEPVCQLIDLPQHLSRRKMAKSKRRSDMNRGKYSLEQVQGMLAKIEPSDRDLWRSVGIILGREFVLSDEAWTMYQAWSDKWSGAKGRNHNEIMRQAFYEISQEGTERQLTIGTIVSAAIDGGWVPRTGEVPLHNFVYFGPGNNYIYRPTMSYWVAPGVDAAVSPVNESGALIKASEWLKEHSLMTSMTCDPSIETDVLEGHDCRNGETIAIPGSSLYNTYRKATIELGDAKMATPFCEHVKRVFNKSGDADQFIKYMAHRVQKPWEKPRFALLLAGGQGIGKDTAVEFCCPAIGSWNVANIDPSNLEEGFNEYVASTLVRISEAANLHEMTKWAFNERTKVLIAGSPDTCMVNPKYGQKFSVRMYCGVIITTNHLASGIFIPADDRRYDVIESATMAEMGLLNETVRKEYFSRLWDWFMAGGDTHIAAYLHSIDLSNWSSANGQRKTEAHKTVVAAGMASDYWLSDILDELEWPKGLRVDTIVTKAEASGEKLGDIRRKIGATLGRAGYVLFKNDQVKDGRWYLPSANGSGKNVGVTVYVKAGTSSDYSPLQELKPLF